MDRRYDDYDRENYNDDRRRRGGSYGDGRYDGGRNGQPGQYPPQNYPPQNQPYPPQNPYPPQPYPGQYPPQNAPYPGQYPPPQYPPQDGYYRGEGVTPLGGDEAYDGSIEEKKRRGILGMFRKKEESITGSDGSNIIITYPRSHHDIRVIIDNLRRRQAIIVDLSRMPDKHAQRILDFLSGAIYALCGSQQRIGPNMFLLTPGGMAIQVPMDIKKKYD